MLSRNLKTSIARLASVHGQKRWSGARWTTLIESSRLGKGFNCECARKVLTCRSFSEDARHTAAASVTGPLSGGSDMKDWVDEEDYDSEEMADQIPTFTTNYEPVDNQKRTSFNKIDIEGPHLWFPEARHIKRKIFLHVGPTNSGKTHQAIQRLKESTVGLYAAPLRLLAWQVSNDLNCNLVTGQEAVEVEDSDTTSCTVEMCDLEVDYDCAVIDEIQLISSDDRGAAFSRALLGLRASEIHLCGEEGAVNLIEKICQITGDELEVKRYKRLSPLQHAQEHLDCLSKVKPGDAVVVFSRKQVYRVKQDIETLTSHKCAMVYGSLPPETRKQQATLFNEGKDYPILVATDAIGMGLNLSIKRVIFNKLTKYDGKEDRLLNLREIKQIAGRAGRFGFSDSDGGFAAAMTKDDHILVKSAVNMTSPINIGSAFVYPPKEFIRARFHNVFIDCLQETLPEFEKFLIEAEENLNSVKGRKRRLEEREKIAVRADEVVGLAVNIAYCKVIDEIEATRVKALQEGLRTPFKVAVVDELRDRLKVLESVPVDVRTLQTLCDAPVSTTDTLEARAYHRYATFHRKTAKEIIEQTFSDPFYHDLFGTYVMYSGYSPYRFKKTPELPRARLRPVRNSSTTATDMNELERNYRVLDLGLWLSWRFEHSDEQREKVIAQRNECTNMIRQALIESSKSRHKKRTDKERTERNEPTDEATTKKLRRNRARVSKK